MATEQNLIEHNHMEENCFRPKPCPRCILNETAPDLLKVCKKLLDYVQDCHRLDKNWGQCQNATGKGECGLCELINEAEATLAKAGGG